MPTEVRDVIGKSAFTKNVTFPHWYDINVDEFNRHFQPILCGKKNNLFAKKSALDNFDKDTNSLLNDQKMVKKWIKVEKNEWHRAIADSNTIFIKVNTFQNWKNDLCDSPKANSKTDPHPVILCLILLRNYLATYHPLTKQCENYYLELYWVRHKKKNNIETNRKHWGIQNSK